MDGRASRMPVTWLKRTFFPELFVIDERPEEVYVPVLRESVVEAAAEGTGAGSVEGENGQGAGDDLFAEISRLLLEQVRLEQKAKHLESGQRGDDEFARFIRQALPFLDNFWRLLEMAREHPPSDELKNWLGNVESLYFRIVRLLESYGLVFMNAVGKEVNLDYHEVIEYRPSKEHPHNQVIKEMEKGVVFRSRLLRDAKVVVAFNP
jgi:molecular chaperone GrpE